jgi:hypothetical protein
MATTLATSAHCTTKLCPGYSGASIGVCNAVVTASAQRWTSNATGSLTRRLAPLLKRASAASSWPSSAAMRSAGVRPSTAGFASARRKRSSAPPAPSHSRRAESPRRAPVPTAPRAMRNRADDRVFEGLERCDVANAA